MFAPFNYTAIFISIISLTKNFGERKVLKYTKVH